MPGRPLGDVRNARGNNALEASAPSWLSAALLASPVSLLAQRDSATTRIVPLWRDGQLVTRVSGDPNAWQALQPAGAA